jgi:GFO/IDH/MocA oxidoreductase family protein
MSACLAHLANAAYRAGARSLQFDPRTESFLDHDGANHFLKPAYRKNYRVPEAV